MDDKLDALLVVHELLPELCEVEAGLLVLLGEGEEALEDGLQAGGV